LTYHFFRSIRTEIAQRIAAKRAQFPRFNPQLAIVQAGARPDSSAYVRMKAKAAEEVGIAFRHVNLDAEATAAEITKLVEDLNKDDDVSGLLVQLPLGEAVGADGERLVTEAISPHKDVDG
jgi:methylenetetrahydrofolate dehydrogenase (NADP+)/methenyltetrahydrofolate cyclohydrolase/formyltetrahydrofolate synthetase